MRRPTSTPAPSPNRPRQPGRPRRWLRRAFARFWAVPAVWCVAAVAAGVLIPDYGEGEWMPFVFRGGADGAREVLSTIAGAMISVTGLVFSTTLVTLQLASSQFSPRVLSTFLADRVTQNTLGVFTASFVYALTVLRSVEDDPNATVPQLGVTVGFLLVLAAVGMFLAFIHRITQAISVTTVIRAVGDTTRALLERDSGASGLSEEEEVPDLPRHTVVTAPRSGYLDTLDHHRLVAAAGRLDVRIEVLHRLGTFIPEGAPLAMLRGDGELPDVDGEDLVEHGVGLSPERTMEQDFTFGMRRLVDIAERALSPGVNDPTTATQAIDELHDLLRRLVVRPDPDAVWRDSDRVRLLTTEYTFSDLLDLAVDEIAHWGAEGVQTPRRLDQMLLDLEVAATPEHRPVILAKAGALLS